MEIYYSIDHLTKRENCCKNPKNIQIKPIFGSIDKSENKIYQFSFSKDQKDFYFQLEYLCRSHNFSLEYEMAVFKVSLSCVEPNLIFVTSVALNMCQK